MTALMDLRRSIVVLMVLAAVLVSLGGVGPFGSPGERGGCGCCSDCGDGCACPLPPLGDDAHATAADGLRFGGPVVTAECSSCPVAVGGTSSHRLDAREARAFARTERPVRVGRALETRPSERSAEPCPEISPRAPPSVRV